MQWEKIQLKIFAGFEYSVKLNGWNIKAWNSMNNFFWELNYAKWEWKRMNADAAGMDSNCQRAK